MTMTEKRHGLTKFDRYMGECLRGLDSPNLRAPAFGRLGDRNPVSGFSTGRVIEKVTDALFDLRSDEIVEGPAPAGMTFFGQFIDHDITLDVTSQIGRTINPAYVRNFRTPGLDLDNVYGAGPEATPHFYSRRRPGYLFLGTRDNPDLGTKANRWDLPRNREGRALIGDPRNDENGILSQIQSLFIQFANIAHQLAVKEPEMFADAGALCDASDPENRFEAARMMVRWHYQWLVVHDFLPSFVDADVLDEVCGALARDDLPKPFREETAVIPVEFAVAAFRFGHATVQPRYRLNDHLTLGLFEAGSFSAVAPEHEIDLTQFFDTPAGPARQRARPVGPSLAGPLFELPGVTDEIQFDGHVIGLEAARSLAHRNVFRDRLSLELESGERMAIKMGLEVRPDLDVLTRVGITKMPLWMYILGEGEAHGGRLGGVGGRIVATTLLRLLKIDRSSVLYQPDFRPRFGAVDGEAYTLGHLFHWVRQNRDVIDFWDELVL